jgi:D-3-phosphoglycerate dehydrogenase
MEVIAHDPFVSAEGARTGSIPLLSLDDLLPRSDFLTLHVPLTAATKGMIGGKELASLPRGARLINCARGGIVDEAALAKALESGHLAGAALDVFAQEPPAQDLPFRGMDQVILTPHLAASTSEAQEKVAVLIADQVCDYLRDGVARNAANVTSMDPRQRELAAPYLELAETLGRCQGELLEGRLHEITVECSGDVPEEALPAVTIAVLKGYLERFLHDPVNAVNAAWLAKERGLELREVRSRASHDYQNLITTIFRSDQRSRAITGTVFGRNLPRIVALDGFRFDALPRGALLLVSNDDRPGIVGRIGTLLGDNRINIAHMSLGRDREGGQALAAISVDTPVPPEIASKLQATPGIVWVKSIHL